MSDSALGRLCIAWRETLGGVRRTIRARRVRCSLALSFNPLGLSLIPLLFRPLKSWPVEKGLASASQSAMPHLLELYCGTKSVGRVFEQNGWTVTSVDILPSWSPTICCDCLDLTPEMVLAAGPKPDLIHGSPCCTHYSKARTNARTPRDLIGADKMVQKVLDLAAFFECDFFMENPVGLLYKRDVVRGIPMYRVDYCKYGDDDWIGYKKPTCIWHNGRWRPQRVLCKPQTCPFWTGGKWGQGGRHLTQAQRHHSRSVLYALPAALPQEWCDAYAGAFQ